MTKRYTSNNSEIEKVELSLYEPYSSETIDKIYYPEKWSGGKKCAEQIINNIFDENLIEGHTIPSLIVIWFNDGDGVHRRRFHLSKNWNITKQDGGYY